MFFMFLRNVFFGIVFFMSSVSFSQSLSSQIQIPIEKYKLSNGLTVVLNPNPKTTVASYYLGIFTGSRHEKLGVTGISHMFEHLMFKGTDKYPKVDAVYSENGIVGMNAHTHFDYTGYFASFPEKKLELILDVESDRMDNLKFSQEDLDKERSAVQEERRLRLENQPLGQFFSETLLSVVFKKHSYRWPIIGHKKDIAAYTLKDLKSWYNSYYSPNNAVLVLSGRFKERNARQLIEKYFGPLKSKEIPKEVFIKEPEQVQPRYFALKKEVQTSTVALAWRLPESGTKEFLALEILTDILGAGESSRFYKKMVRNKKLLQGVSCSLFNLLQGGIFLVSYTLPKISNEEVVKKEILEEIKKITVENITEEELQKSKNIYLNGVVNNLKHTSSRAYYLASYEMNFKDYKKMYESLNQLEEISLDFIREVAKKYLNFNKMSYLILKPKVSA